ncbi:MAG: cupin domain-containing protein [Smithellaceae bacterium]|nr:cupin domain-containing protein [Smithellaceae bacterium]NLX52265.1 cupin domain-containing protein [Deltaproteobacteria bacterium]
MKIVSYPTLAPTRFDIGPARGVAGRVVIGKDDGAEHFCMRVFELAPEGHTPAHAHAWEHEIFVHAGAGEAFTDGQWHPLGPGTVLFIPAGKEHQIRNIGKEMLVFVCLIPAGAPEL